MPPDRSTPASRSDSQTSNQQIKWNLARPENTLRRAYTQRRHLRGFTPSASVGPKRLLHSARGPRAARTNQAELARHDCVPSARQGLAQRRHRPSLDQLLKCDNPARSVTGEFPPVNITRSRPQAELEAPFRRAGVVAQVPTKPQPNHPPLLTDKSPRYSLKRESHTHASPPKTRRMVSYRFWTAIAAAAHHVGRQ